MNRALLNGSINADRTAQGGANFHVEDKIGQRIEARGLAIENDQRSAVLRGYLGKASSRINLKGRADRNKQVTGQGFFLRPAHGEIRHRLTEGDCRPFNVTAAVATDRNCPIGQKSQPDRFQLMTQSTIQTGGIGAVAMQFDNLIVRYAGRQMQPIGILGNDGGDLTGANEFFDRAMTPVGFGPVEAVGICGARIRHGLRATRQNPDTGSANSVSRHRLATENRVCPILC